MFPHLCLFVGGSGSGGMFGRSGVDHSILRMPLLRQHRAVVLSASPGAGLLVHSSGP